MKKVTAVKTLPNYTIYVTFEDGKSGILDLSARLHGPVFEPLKSKKLFDDVSIDEFGAITWGSGADLAPDALYNTIEEREDA